jgi:hypothetical protein
MTSNDPRSFVSRILGGAVSVLLAAFALYWAACLIRAAWLVLAMTGGVLLVLGSLAAWYRARRWRW